MMSMYALLRLLSIFFCFIPAISHAAAIHDAAKKGDVASISAALDAGADINGSDAMAPPLYYAVIGSKLEAAKILIERGADVNAPSKLGDAPLVPAVGKRNIELIKLLLDHGANPNSVIGTETVLHLAVERGCFDCVKALVEAGADVNAVTSNVQYRTPLHIAKLRGLGEVADYLLTHGVIIPKPEPISPKLAVADVQKGQAVFEANCGRCHSAIPKERKVGPNLWGVVGRDKAAVAEITYSEALKAWSGVWTYEDLNTYLYGPTLTMPGVLMEIRGIPDETERVNLIAYLRTLNDNPLPLP
jgi:cytochrome c